MSHKAQQNRPGGMYWLIRNQTIYRGGNDIKRFSGGVTKHGEVAKILFVQCIKTVIQVVEEVE